MAQPPEKDPRVTITLRHGTSDKQATFNLSNKVEKVREEGGKLFKIDSAKLPSYTLHLLLPDGTKQQLVTTEKLNTYSVKDGSIIVLQPPDGEQG